MSRSMTSNLLGEVGEPRRGSAIISAGELIAREGIELHKGMNFRPSSQGDSGELLSVFLVLESERGFRDAWDEARGVYAYKGHDSTTVEGGKLRDQVAMYESGKLTDNGRFLKAAQEYKDGVRKEPLQIQIYEKVTPGVWFDKGIFDLIDAEHVSEEGRKAFKFYLRPVIGELSREDQAERMISAEAKAAAWQRQSGRCSVCGSEVELHFVGSEGNVRLACAEHSSRQKRGLL